jgi:phage host-nuclease inhibitor protein Gam
MARVKPAINVTVIKSLEEADSLLGRIAALQRNIDLIETGLNDDIDALKLKAAAEAEPFRQEAAELGEALCRYATYNKPDLFKDRKSLELTFGQIGFRQSTKVAPASRKITWEQVVQTLLDRGMDDYIRVKREADKEALKALSEEEYKSIGLKLDKEDKFFYEIASQELNHADGNH